MKDQKNQRSRFARIGLPVIGTALYATLLFQAGCPDDDSNNFADAAAPTATTTSTNPAATTTTTIPTPTPDAQVVALDVCWKAASGKSYSSSGPANCGILSTQISTPGDVITAAPLGQNASVAWTAKAGAPAQATATGLTIFDAGSHTCTLKCIALEAGAPLLNLECTNPGGGFCGQALESF